MTVETTTEAKNTETITLNVINHKTMGDHFIVKNGRKKFCEFYANTDGTWMVDFHCVGRYCSTKESAVRTVIESAESRLNMFGFENTVELNFK